MKKEQQCVSEGVKKKKKVWIFHIKGKGFLLIHEEEVTDYKASGISGMWFLRKLRVGIVQVGSIPGLCLPGSLISLWCGGRAGQLQPHRAGAGALKLERKRRRDGLCSCRFSCCFEYCISVKSAIYPDQALSSFCYLVTVPWTVYFTFLLQPLTNLFLNDQKQDRCPGTWLVWPVTGLCVGLSAAVC